MVSAAELRGEAERCRRLAAGVDNRELAAKLVTLAEEFEAAAADRETDEGEAIPPQAPA